MHNTYAQFRSLTNIPLVTCCLVEPSYQEQANVYDHSLESTTLNVHQRPLYQCHVESKMFGRGLSGQLPLCLYLEEIAVASRVVVNRAHLNKR